MISNAQAMAIVEPEMPASVTKVTRVKAVRNCIALAIQRCAADVATAFDSKVHQCVPANLALVAKTAQNSSVLENPNATIEANAWLSMRFRSVSADIGMQVMPASCVDFTTLAQTVNFARLEGLVSQVPVRSPVTMDTLKKVMTQFVYATMMTQTATGPETPVPGARQVGQYQHAPSAMKIMLDMGIVQ